MVPLVALLAVAYWPLATALSATAVASRVHFCGCGPSPGRWAASRSFTIDPFGTGSAPGNARHTGHTFVFGSPPNSFGHPQNILLVVFNST